MLILLPASRGKRLNSWSRVVHAHDPFRTCLMDRYWDTHLPGYHRRSLSQRKQRCQPQPLAAPCSGGCGPSLAACTYSLHTNRESVSCIPGSLLSQPWQSVYTVLTGTMTQQVTSTCRPAAFNSTLTICTSNYPNWGSLFLKREIIFNFYHPTWVSSQEHRAWWES